VAISRSKTKAGERRIDLNLEALYAFAELERIVEQVGGGDPSHYFFGGGQPMSQRNMTESHFGGIDTGSLRR
jgi:hypothetical protein